MYIFCIYNDTIYMHFYTIYIIINTRLNYYFVVVDLYIFAILFGHLSIYCHAWLILNTVYSLSKYIMKCIFKNE
jgi:hypothetical protein